MDTSKLTVELSTREKFELNINLLCSLDKSFNTFSTAYYRNISNSNYKDVADKISLLVEETINELKQLKDNM